MYLNERNIRTKYQRVSSAGNLHTYYRNKTVVILKCDNCSIQFERERGSMDPKRLSNNYFHVCKNCDSKVFAQKKGVERKQVWNMTASSSTPISKL